MDKKFHLPRKYNASYKLTEADEREIIELRKAGHSYSYITAVTNKVTLKRVWLICLKELEPDKWEEVIKRDRIARNKWNKEHHDAALQKKRSLVVRLKREKFVPGYIKEEKKRLIEFHKVRSAAAKKRRDLAMDDVRAVIKKHGVVAVGSCLKFIHENHG